MQRFDLSVYFPIPALDTEGLAALTKVVLRDIPEPSTPSIELTAEQLGDALAQTERAFVERIEQERGNRRLRGFDLLVGMVWDELDERLRAHAKYLHEATAELDAEDRELLDFDVRVARAREAAKVHAKLFGGGKDFLRSPYPQQAVQMAARLQWVASKADEFELAELVGADLVTMLHRCQARYEALVHERASDSGRAVADLRELRDTLRRRLAAYLAAVGATADERDPASVERVERALRPILVARAHARRGSAAATVEDLDAALDQLAQGEGEGGEELGLLEDVGGAGALGLVEPEAQPDPQPDPELDPGLVPAE